MKFKDTYIVYYFLGILLFIFTCLSFVVSRDQRFLLNNFILENRANKSEFFLVSNFCNDLPMCFRVVSSWIGELITLVLFQVVTVVQKFPSTHYPVLNETYTAFTFTFSSLLYRFFSFLIILYLIYILTKRFLFSIFLVTVTILYSSHILHYIVLINLSNIDFFDLERAVNGSINILNMFLVYYDYAALLVVGLLFVLHYLYLNNQFNFRWYNLFIISFIFTGIYEYLGILLAISFIFTKYKHKYLYLAFSFLGAVLAIIILYFSLADAGTSQSKQATVLGTNLFETYLFYSRNNLDNIPVIFVSIFLIMILPILSGTILGVLSRRFIHFNLRDAQINAFKPVLIALPFVYFVGFFTSAIAGEFARQALPFEFYIFIYSYLRTLKSKFQTTITDKDSLKSSGNTKA